MLCAVRKTVIFENLPFKCKICCDNFISDPNSYTYSHDSLGQRKWNDHFLVSFSLITSTDCHEILDVGDKPSDHLPIALRLSTNTFAESPRIVSHTTAPSLKWDKCSEGQKSQYKEQLSSLLLHYPGVITACSVMHCQSRECIDSI